MKALGKDSGVAVLLLSLVVACLTFDRLASAEPPPSTFHDLDLRLYFAPAVDFVRASLWNGELPLWNPFQLAGYPFAATLQPALYYPLLTTLTIFPTTTALSVHVVVHLLLAGTFTWSYARSLGTSPIAAFAAACVYMLSAPVMNAIFNTAMLSSIVWLPALAWRIEALRRDPKPSNAAWLALALALAFLAGHPQTFLYTAQFCALYGFFVLALRGESRLRASAWLSVSCACALLLVGVQLLPSLELVSDAVRGSSSLGMAAGSAWEELSRLSMFSLRPGGEAVGLPLLTIPAAVIAAIGRRRREHGTFLLVLGVIVLDLMRAQGGVLYDGYSRLPLAGLFREPSRMAFIVALCASGLIACALDNLRTWRLPRIIPVAIASMLCADSYLANAPNFHYAPLARPDVYRISATLERFAKAQASEQRFFIEDFFQSSRLPHNTGQALRIFVNNAYEPLLPGAYARMFEIPAATMWSGLLTVLDVFKVEEGFRPLQQKKEFLDLFSVRFYVDPKGEVGSGNPHLSSKLREARRVQLADVHVFEREAALPRAYVAYDYRHLPNETSAIAATKQPAFDPRRTAVVASSGDPSLHAPSVSSGMELTAATVTRVTANAVDVEVRAEAGGLLVLTDLDYPGWHAKIDGSPVEIHRTNGIFRGVEITAGAHVVQFHYSPRTFHLGLAMTVAGAVSFVGLLAMRGRRDG
ncbi:MAG TPA: YfhO family protein [Candidatus Binatia bacterium]|nr:YfhO family protein [Candidatus Binatia bacterium]